MTKIIALLCLLFVTPSFASISTNENALKIMENAKAKRAKLRLNQSLVKILKPDTIRQGEPFSFFFQSATEIEGTNSLISLEIDGAPVATLEQPAKGFFTYYSNGLSVVREHNAIAKLSIEDAAESASIRNAIVQLELEIDALQEQIDETPPGAEQDALIAQQNEKIAIKNQLTATLAALAMPIGQEAFTFNVVAAPNSNPDYFRITTVSPTWGNLTGGTQLTITGARFPVGLTAYLGGVELPVTRISATTLNITSPDFTSFGGEGSKNLELRLTGNSTTPDKNAVRNGAFYAATVVAPPVVNKRPVAIAGFPQFVSLGAAVTMNGSLSFDENPGTTLSYAWTIVSSPIGSGLTNGSIYSTNTQFSFTPTRPGAYIWGLVVSDGSLTSLTSTSVVTVNPPNNSAPVPTAAAISVAPNGTVTRQVLSGDADSAYQSHSYIVTRQSNLGIASMNVTGLLTFAAGANPGAGSIEVAVVDNGNPSLTGFVTIPVTVVAGNAAPVFNTTTFFTSIRSKGFPITTLISANGTFGDPDGTVTSCYWTFLGVTVYGDTLAAACDASVDFYATGDIPATLTIVDNLGASTTISAILYLRNEETPDGKFTINPVSGSAPFTATFDGSPGSIPGGGTIARYRWNFADGTGNISGITLNHTFNNPGIYRIQLRDSVSLANQGYQTVSNLFTNVYVGQTPPAYGFEPIAQARFSTGRQVILGNPIQMDGSTSFDPGVGASIVSHSWQFNDLASCANGCFSNLIAPSYTYPAVGQYSLGLTVTDNQGGANSAFYSVFVVNQGNAPRSVVTSNVITGAAPLTVNFSAARSYDYDGTIQSYNFMNGEGGAITNSGSLASHTFTTPGVYFPGFDVIDNHGNKARTFLTVTVLPANAKVPAKKQKLAALREPGDGGDGEEDYKSNLTFACSQGSGQACNDLAQIYQAEGDTFTAEKLFERACLLGYQAACSIF